LAQDLPWLEVPLVARDPGEAERALQGTARLRGDADGAPPLFRDEDALDGGAVVQTEQELDGPVRGVAALGHGGPAHLVAFGQAGAQALAQVGHGLEGPRALPVEPDVELAPAEGGLALLRGQGLELAAVQAEQVQAALASGRRADRRRGRHPAAGRPAGAPPPARRG